MSLSHVCTHTQLMSPRAEQTLEMVGVMGCTVLLSGSLSLMRSSPAYFFRATSGATHHGLHIPAVTLEVPVVSFIQSPVSHKYTTDKEPGAQAGPHNVAEPAARDAASAAIHNVMSWSGMLPGASLIDVSKITPAHLNLDNLHREISYPVVRKRGIVDLVVPAGAAFVKGDLLANVRSIDGILLEELRADFDGHVLCWSPGVVRMEGETLGIWSATIVPSCSAFHTTFRFSARRGAYHLNDVI